MKHRIYLEVKPATSFGRRPCTLIPAVFVAHPILSQSKKGAGIFVSNRHQ